MTTPRRRALLAWAAALAFAAPLSANEMPSQMAALRGSMARFAQPVRVGDLPARYLLAPSEGQRVLGRVAPGGVVRTEDGHLRLLVDRGGVLGLGTTRVAVKLEDVALLGEHVVLIGLSPAALRALPAAEAASFSAVPADTLIRMAIVGPFH